MIYFFILLQILILVLIAFGATYSYLRFKKQKKLQNILVQKYTEKVFSWDRIFIAKESFFQKWGFKFLQYEYCGILINQDNSFQIIYIDENNKETVHNFCKEQSFYKHKDNFFKSAFYWYEISQLNDKIYICAEVANAISSKEKSADLINKIYGNTSRFIKEDTQDFDLMKNKSAKTIAIAIVVLFVITIFYQALSPIKIISNFSSTVISFIFALSAIGVYFHLKKQLIPLKESFILSLLFSISMHFFSPVFLAGYITLFGQKQTLSMTVDQNYYLKSDNTPGFSVKFYKDFYNQHNNKTQEVKIIQDNYLNLYFYNRAALEEKYKQYYQKK